MNNKYENRFDFAKDLSKEAGALALEYFKRFYSLKLDEKAHSQDMVSEADVAVEKLILDAIKSHFPEDGFLGEEGGLIEANGTYWVIDPIDGTANFIRGLSIYCISIAYVKDNKVDFGVIYDPNLDELFYASRGTGAYLNGTQIKVDNVPFNKALIDLGRCKKGVEYPNYTLFAKMFEEGGVYRHMGAGALNLAFIASGRLSAFYEDHIMPWDAFAGLVICEEAGAIVNDYMNTIWIDGGEIFVAVPSIADKLKELIQSSQ